MLTNAVDALERKAVLFPSQDPKLRGKFALPTIGDLTGAMSRAIGRKPAGAGIPEDPKYPLIRELRGGLSIEPVRDSHLVNISFVSASPAFAAEAANAIANGYILFTMSGRKDIADQSELFFTNQLAKLQDDITRQDINLQKYAAEKGIITGTGDLNELTVKNLDELRGKMTEAQAEVANTRARLQSLERTPPAAIEEVRNNELIQRLSSTVAEQDTKYREQLTTYGPNLPAVRQLKEALDSSREQLETATAALAQKAIAGARADYERAQGVLKGLEGLQAQSASQVTQLKEDYVEFLAMKAQLDRTRQTYNEFLKKQTDMRMSGLMLDGAEKGQNVRVIDAAQPPRVVYKPKVKLNTLLGLLFGLFLGVAVAFLMEYVDNTLKTPEDVRSTLNMAVLGMIPAQEFDPKHRSGRSRRPEVPEHATGAADPALITAQQPLSPISEAYRELRTSVLLATAGHPPRDIAVTSCQPSEGKTTTALNLAIALAQLGRRVLIVDTDLRRPRCHLVLKASPSRGVSTFLTGMSGLDALVQPTTIERVSLVAAGPIPPNPAELLDSDRFREMIALLRGHEEYDHIIYDSPPVLSVVDPLLIGRHTDGTILVIKSGFTTRDAGRLGKEKLDSGRLNVLGIVLNAVRTENVPYQYRYYRYGYARDNKDEADRVERERSDEVPAGDTKHS
ncbi:MAG: polysaccharide biosynthesis tyrosine autokinase [Acidobacteria bacterium]|nr:polysaccharide biosynthesis tyrosine autokinase [Acidobacteriota bacterium]